LPCGFHRLQSDLAFEESGSCGLPAKVRLEKVSQNNNTSKRNLNFFAAESEL
jgi:hypothetical protein